MHVASGTWSRILLIHGTNNDFRESDGDANNLPNADTIERFLLRIDVIKK